MLLMMLFVSINSQSGELVAQLHQQRLVAGQTVEVFMAAFRFSLTAAGIDGRQPWQIDGQTPIGGFPSLPGSRLGSFYLVWNGRRLNIPPVYYQDVFDPPLAQRRGWWDHAGVMISVADDEQSLLIELLASESACCGYRVIWLVDAEGNVSRFSDPSIP